jgi:hypothetical protein
MGRENFLQVEEKNSCKFLDASIIFNFSHRILVCVVGIHLIVGLLAFRHVFSDFLAQFVFDKQLNSNNFKFGEKSCGECTTIL